MFKLQFENSKEQTIELFGHPFRLMKVEGLGDVGADIQMQRSPYQDGSTLIDTVLEPRHMTIELKIYGKDAEETERNRRRFASVFNPKLMTGKLKYVRGNEVKVIDAAAESFPFFPDGRGNRSDTFQKAVLYLICPDPYWRSTTIVEEPMAAFVELFELPSDEFWEVGEDGDLYFEMGMEGEKRIFEINGDAEVPVHITFNGPSTNPVVRNNTTGEFIKVDRTLEKGDVLVIDTSDALVEINGMDAFPWIDINSSFWKLQIGENEVEYTADAGAEEAELVISWQERFNAV